MRFVSFLENNTSRHGLLFHEHETDWVLDLARATKLYAQETNLDAESLSAIVSNSMLGFIENGEQALAVAKEIEQLARTGFFRRLGAATPFREVCLQAPIPKPSSMRDGYAFRQHVETARKNRGLEMIPEFDQFPVFYFTNHQAVTGPGPIYVRSRHLERLDYELEAAVVIGKKGRNLSVHEADASIFGLTVMNDWSARALQMDEMKLSLGPAKGKDFATSLGPVLVTLDELAEYVQETSYGRTFDLPMHAWVNGKLLSSGNVRDMHWTFAQLIERISYGVDVFPGDVIGSGTCGTGCLLELNGSKITNNLWLQPGDHVTLSIEHIGRLENSIVLDD